MTKEREEQIVEGLQELKEAVNEALMQSADVFTVEQTAKVLDVSVAHVYRLTAARELPFYRGKGGKRMYFRKQDVVDYMLHERIASKEENAANTAAYIVRRKGGAA